MLIAIITARGGSRRIPRKNIRKFYGKPIIAWSIETAIKSGCFDHVLVSTEDEEIAAIARGYGAEVPYLRPVELADHYTDAHLAARNMLEWSLKQWADIPAFAHIYPTAPFLTVDTIHAGLDCIRQGKKYAYTVKRLTSPFSEGVIKDGKGGIRRISISDENFDQIVALQPAYLDIGQLYWFDTASFLEKEIYITTDVELLEMPPKFAIDINTEADWQQAEAAARDFFTVGFDKD